MKRLATLRRATTASARASLSSPVWHRRGHPPARPGAPAIATVSVVHRPAKRPYRLPVSVFIVDIYFCNYLPALRPGLKMIRRSRRLPLPLRGLPLLTHKHNSRGVGEGFAYVHVKSRRQSWQVACHLKNNKKTMRHTNKAHALADKQTP